MVNLVILPIIDETLKIDYYIDSTGKRYDNIKEVLSCPGTNYFFYYYQLVSAEFEKWSANEGVELKFSKTQLSYTGTPKTYNWYTSNIFQFTADEDPKMGKIRGYFNKKSFIFYDLKKYKRDINDFNITLLDLVDSQNYINYFMNVIVPQCSHNIVPNSIAAAARHIFLNPDKLVKDDDDFLFTTRSAAIGGLYYLKNKKTYKKIYDYDISSMYPYWLVNGFYPNIQKKPIYKDHFIEVGKNELALYHIKELRAVLKPQHFPTIWTQKEFKNDIRRYGYCDDDAIIISNVEEVDGWITNIDYQMLKRDYYIVNININETYLFLDVVNGEIYFHELREFYEQKQQSRGTLRDLYKVIIDSYSGSLAMRKQFTRKIKYISLSMPQETAIFAPDSKPSPSHIYAFMTAYARNMISELALYAGFDNVISIDTDGIFTLNRKLDGVCDKGLGALRLDKIMKNARWFGMKQYEYQDENDEWVPTIAGLPGYLYKHNQMIYEIPQIRYDKKNKKFKKNYMTFKIGDDSKWN